MDELTLKVLAAEIGPRCARALVESVSNITAAAFALSLSSPAGRTTLVIAPGGNGTLHTDRRVKYEELKRRHTGLEGMTVAAVEPWSDDRILVVRFSGGAGDRRLVVEYFGRAGGVFVLHGDAVAERWGGRRLAAGAPYVFPPSRGRTAPDELLRAGSGFDIAAGGAKALVEKYALMSPLTARAVVVAGGDELAVRRRLAEFARVAGGGAPVPVTVCDAGLWHPFPCDIFDGSGAETRRFPTMDEAAAFAWRENAERAGFEAARARVLQRLRRAVEKWRRQREAVERGLEAYERYDEYRKMGEALKYNLGAVAKGACEVTLPDPSGEGNINVSLEPSLTPAENAARLFTLYRKAKRGLAAATARLEAVAAAQAKAEAELTAAEQAADLATLAPWVTDERKPARRGAEAATPPGRRYTSADGFLVVAGRSAAENDALTFGYARPHDLWLHAQQAHGAHVIIRRNEKAAAVPRQTVEQAAAVAALYSDAKHAALVPVVVVERRHVRRVRGRPGTVTYRGGDVVFVAPADAMKAAPARGPSSGSSPKK